MEVVAPTSFECSDCKASKPAAAFPRNKRRPFGLDFRCKDCFAAKRKSRYDASEAVRQMHRNASRKYRYGVHLEEFNALFESQKGCCAVCSRHQSESKKTFALDHDHETDRTRGLLCNECNLMLGLAYDDPAILASAIEYLRRTAPPVATATKEKDQQ